MSITIGLRFYKISVTKRGTQESVDFSDVDPYPFIKEFLSKNTNFVDNEVAQRSWSLEEYDGTDAREFWGLIRYGAYGFTSRLLDRKTRQPNYHRKSTDLEEIPLFFQIWLPKGGNFGMAAFQSFQGRSCVQLIMSAVSEAFKQQHPQHYIRFEKVSPNYLAGSSFGDAPVKKLTMISKSHRADPFSELMHGAGISEYNYEVAISAKRNRNLGPLSNLGKQVADDPDAILLHRGTKFDRLIAEVTVNGKRRRVGLAGDDPDTGTIDVTDAVKLKDGHPTFASISSESNSIMAEIYEKMSG